MIELFRSHYVTEEAELGEERNCGLRIGEKKLRIANFGLRISDCGLEKREKVE